MTEPELKRVQPEDILGEKPGEVRFLTPLQQVGVRGALLVGALGGTVLIVLLIRWMLGEPVAPQIPEAPDPKLAQAILDRYKELKALNADSTVKMIDTVIVRILLPVFTSFVGFIFGSQAGGGSR